VTSSPNLGNSAPKEKEKESSKREKLKERDNENIFVQPSTVQRSPRSLGELRITYLEMSFSVNLTVFDLNESITR
jgi:hypothetical protein